MEKNHNTCQHQGSIRSGIYVTNVLKKSFLKCFNNKLNSLLKQINIKLLENSYVVKNVNYRKNNTNFYYKKFPKSVQ